ncbi:PREDICTED: uncharacterized protein LOC109357704 isoform X1 [Lupinus angustifolius]|uniref:uncharacterized protein LOC109357704 isoform X1 n=1 Tax=Lupinus angustifolius TaxID=3871 RepID=UPI00092EDE2A|nr:PREDICTED: uncharacterized protein LOC109357704 isoform X1 [Lupinus angustifolius]
MKPTEAEDNAFDGTNVVSQRSDGRSLKHVSEEEGVHQTITEGGENVEDDKDKDKDKILGLKPDYGGEIDKASHESPASDAGWVCKSPNSTSSTASIWPSFNTKSSKTYPLSEEERATVAVLDMQLKALELCKEFLVGNAGSDCDEDEIDDEDEDATDDEDEDELVDSYGSEESKEYKFFERLFAEDGDLRRYYENNHKEGAFYCLVCGPVWKKVWKRFKDCVSLVHHSTTVLRTKRMRAHRAYARIICKIIGWDFDQLPVIVLKDLDNSVAGLKMLLDEAKNPAMNYIGDSNIEPDKPADVHNDDSDVQANVNSS